MIHILWAGFFALLAVLLTLFGYGYVHEGVLGGAIMLSVLAAMGIYLRGEPRKERW